MNPFSLQNKTIIITGASSGIGAQTAIDCSNLGAKLILLGRNQDRLNFVKQKLQDPGNHKTISIDLTHTDKLEKVINNEFQDVSSINGLVNAAGISTTLPFKFANSEKMDEFFHTNVHSAINLSRLLIKCKKIADIGASIVFISSVMGMVGEKGKTLYSMTKGALESVNRSLAVEFASKNIRFNCVSPAVVETPMSNKAVYKDSEEAFEKIKELHPLGIGKATDVSFACIYLLSDASRWVTGSNLVVDGGYTAR